jgi:hypothetical protein
MKSAGITLRQLLDAMHEEGEIPTALSRKRKRPTVFRLIDGSVNNPSFEILQRIISGLGGHLSVVWDEEIEESLEEIRPSSAISAQQQLKKRQESFKSQGKRSRRTKKSA